MITESTDWTAIARELGTVFAERAVSHDDEDRFVADNYADARAAKLFSAMVPSELGGGGCSHAEMCAVLRELGRHCGSTALSMSMHQHLVAAAIWQSRNGGSTALLEKVAEKELVLVSTGAKDWMASNGKMEAVEGGYRVSATKVFASGSPAGSILVTSAPYEDPDLGWQVLHFPVPMSADGVRIDEVWRAMGMRGTGSNTVILEDVFVPEGSVSLRRPQGEYHPVWSVVLTVALPLISSVYLGVAEAASEKAVAWARRGQPNPITTLSVGEMLNQLEVARMAVGSMVAAVDGFDFEARIELANEALMHKTLAVNAALATAEKALEVTGGPGYLRGMGLERLVRDAHAGQFHPLSEKKQQMFSGRLALGLDPIE